MPTSFILCLALLMGFASGGPTRIHYKDGKTVEGRVLQQTDDAVIVEISLGLLQIDRERIERMEPIDPRAASEPPAAGADDPPPAAPAPGGSPARAPDEPSRAAAAPSTPDQRPERGSGEAGADFDESDYAHLLEEAPAQEPGPPTSAPDAAMTGFIGFEGRLIDRYSWAQGMSLRGALSVLLGAIVLLWAGFGIGCRICDLSAGSLRTLPSALLWTGLLTGLLFVQGWGPLLVAGVLMMLLIAWIVTAKSILAGSWFQVFSLGVLFVFGAGVVFLLVEVGQHLLELPTNA